MRVALWPVEPALVHHPDVAEGKIEANGIGRIERAERRGDFCGHLPAGRDVVRQAQAVAEPDDMGVERNNQPGRRDARPDSHVDSILPHHPPQKQIQALAGASC